LFGTLTICSNDTLTRLPFVCQSQRENRLTWTMVANAGAPLFGGGAVHGNGGGGGGGDGGAAGLVGAPAQPADPYQQAFE
jgi:hypothetical protein